MIAEDRLIELGRVIRDPTLGRRNEQQITIADLTGVDVQDIQIATMALNSVIGSGHECQGAMHVPPAKFPSP